MSLRLAPCWPLALAPLSACATIIGTVLSPITGPIDAVQCAVQYDVPAPTAVLVVPLMFILSPFAGAIVGAGTDAGFLHNGDYSNPYFSTILRPWKPLVKTP